MVAVRQLRDIPAARAELDAAELALIDEARRNGATWSDLAEALGLASRQAAEQRRQRLAAAALRAPADSDERIAALRAAALDLHRRIGADRRWDRRFTRAALVRETLAVVLDAPPGSLFSLVAASVTDLEAVLQTFGGPTRAAVDRLRASLAEAFPRS